MLENLDVLKKLVEVEYIHRLNVPEKLLCHYTFVKSSYFNPYNYDNVFRVAYEFCNQQAAENPGYIYVYSYKQSPNGNFQIYRRNAVTSNELIEWKATLIREYEKCLQAEYEYARQRWLQENTSKLSENILNNAAITMCKFKTVYGTCNADMYKQSERNTLCDNVEDCFIKALYKKLALQDLKIRELEGKCQ